MNFLWRAIYNILVAPLFYLTLRVHSLFNDKMREGVEGRKGLFGRLSEQLPLSTDGMPVIWFHSSSVGEFEQAKPIIADLRRRAKIVITFFSPSGYNVAANYPLADLVCYLPFDTARNARRMMRLINPALLVFMKFDIWPNYVWAAARADVPVILADARLREKSKRLWPVARSFLKSVHKHIIHCAISDSDAQRLKRICPKNADIRVTGDTRFDQVITRGASAGKKLEGLLPQFDVPVIIAGSTYIEDERVVADAYQKLTERWGRAQLILVPHEPEPERLEEIRVLMSERNIPHVLLSGIEKGAILNGEVVVVDRVGVLAELYMLGDITFMGGSFHEVVHNVMEPAIMGNPVLFGPIIDNSLEAAMLLERGGAIMVRDGEELASELVKLLSDDALREGVGQSAKAMIEENAGATEKIVACIDEFLG